MQFTTVSNPGEVRQILALQEQNLAAALTPDLMRKQGFLTVRHDPDVLQRMNLAAPSVIAKEGEQVVGYALVMPRAFAPDVPILQPMFDMLEQLSWRGQPLREQSRWFVMGQVCIASDYRGRGVFDGLYKAMRSVCRERYDFTVTEVAERNTRSMRAHERVGFKTMHSYTEALTGEAWRVIALDF
ncbi:MAG: GNAT family N-acetyltransferase [Lewinellaceae bacterium]|nr:GNAT family N-acetyltransferase [Saprospiraceae bacterium]MCB9356196.1 GNAT family N-acetyltransferase [Lewinellaceae bacterium]